MGTKHRASEMMTAAMMMMAMMMAMMMTVSSGHWGAKFQEQMNWGQNKLQIAMLMAEI
jgi:hypothetical protein